MCSLRSMFSGIWGYYNFRCLINNLYFHRVDPNCPRVILATASPAKFEEAVQSAGLTPQPTKEVTNLANKPVKYEEMLKGQDWEAMLRAKIDEITAKHSSWYQWLAPNRVIYHSMMICSVFLETL